MAANAKARSNNSPEPVVFEPKSGQHRLTFIILHGRGSTGAKFGPPFLEEPIPDFENPNIRDHYPDAKFVFPTASIRRATIYKRSLVSQWFDCWEQTEPGVHEELQIEGVRESTAYMCGLLRREIELVGAENVVLGGLSQGCATVLMTVLLWTGQPIRAAFGLCGWLPFQEPLLAVGTGARMDWEDVEDHIDDDNPFASPDGGDEKVSDQVGGARRAVELLREELEIAKDLEPTCLSQEISVFAGHGAEDDKVPLRSGQSALTTMRELGLNVVWRDYQDLDHWYSGLMLRDLCRFIDNSA